MVGLIYLGFAWGIGYCLLQAALPSLLKVNREKSLFVQGKSTFDPWLVALPASFLLGILLVTGVTYLLAVLFQRMERPLFWANLITLGLIALGLAWKMITGRKKRSAFIGIKPTPKGFFMFWRRNRMELILILLLTVVWSFFMFRSFYCTAGTMHVGFSVFSDFAPHLAVIRSFSVGANFPTEYPHFAGEGIRYHFFFQFLTGNLEFLGLRIDWAFNLPSILSILAFLVLLYAFAVLVTGEKWVGLLTILLFMFRSSFAFFTFIADLESVQQVVPTIFTNELHIGKTLHEEWGLWAQKVYVNQRHFAFALGIMVMTLMALYPLFQKMVAALKGGNESPSSKVVTTDVTEKNHEAARSMDKGTTKARIREFCWTKDAWWPRDFKRAVVLGIILGLMAFWNGAVVLATLAVLFMLALCSKHRLEYLIIAVLTIIFSLAQSRFFIGSGTGAVSPRLTLGFLSQSQDLLGISAYYLELLGLLPCIILAFFCTSPRGGQWLTLAFTAPLIMATTLQVTPDIAVNHKYVLTAVFLLNILAAYFLYRLFAVRIPSASVLAALLVVFLTITGVVDLITLYNLDKNAWEFRADDPLLKWTVQNTAGHEIFLTPKYTHHPILLAGRKLFCGWLYYPWSAGYDTYSRLQTVKEIYGGVDPIWVRRLLKENNISYIVVDQEVRNSGEYRLNYKLIRDNYALVYADPTQGVEIFRVR